MNTVIYTPSGRALEYASLATNLYRGCDHKCAYCFARGAMQMHKEDFDRPKLRAGNFLAKLEREAAAMPPGDDRILLSFMCDPYQHFDVEQQITRKAIEILHCHGHHVQVLTKGGSRALRDLDLFTPNDAFATTLTCLDATMSRQWEPDAADPLDRIATIRTFHDAGIPTWVSLEPVLSTTDALEIIRCTHTFVDLFKVGRLNYHPHAKTINWQQFAKDVRQLLESLGCAYLLKKDLLQ